MTVLCHMDEFVSGASTTEGVPGTKQCLGVPFVIEPVQGKGMSRFGTVRYSAGSSTVLCPTEA